jgi:GAF domain-containing protein/HAMP domain-containing protein
VSGLRGRLFRKYVLLLVGLVAFVLLVNAGLHFWFGYIEEETAAHRFQQEKARSAARRIEAFIEEIEDQVGWTTAPQWAAAPLEQRQFDYVRLLRQVPAITELIQLDANGKEQLRVSRLAMDVVSSGKDHSEEPSFTEAKKHRVWFSPVYFRKESEPYLTLSMAQAGRNGGVTIAEVNLKLIWDVISGMKIGEGGYAYVIDRNGRLIAHPDISLVLRDTDLRGLPQVAAAEAEAQNDQIAPPAMVARNLGGERVLTAHAVITPLDWTVFVELPLREAMAPLYASAWRNAALLAVAIGLATLAAMFLARRMVGPIRLLQAGAARIGAGELDRRLDIHTGDELEGLAGEFNRMAGDLQKSYAELEQKVEDRTAELKEALDQQTATAEVLGVINSSPGDLAPVFEAVVEKATRLCEATHGYLFTYDDERFHPGAEIGDSRYVEWTREHGPFQPPANTALGRITRGQRLVHVADIRKDDSFDTVSAIRQVAEVSGARSVLTVALRRDEVLLGALGVYRQEVRPFTEKQITLLQNFAAQAVIAMENARLITETREALEQQTATAEVLGVINASPGDLAPVFEAMLERAMQLCGASFGGLGIWQGQRFALVAARGVPQPFADFLAANEVSPGPRSGFTRVARADGYLQAADLADSKFYQAGEPLVTALVDLGGARTSLIVPLAKDYEVLGILNVYRQEVRPFSNKQIALLQNFAAQAVIAMENARLLTETREALEQQTATAEVLQVINSSPGDLGPVFDAMLERAMRLCEAAFGTLWTYDGERFRSVAQRGVPAPYAEYLAHNAPPATAGTGRSRILRGERFVHVADLKDEEPYRAGDPHRRAMVDLGGARTGLIVPLLKDDVIIGFVMIYRQQVRLFSDKQIVLLQNFAAQAVIAMENARLLTETREALEQQTATAEVLQVINSSPGDLAPVFDVILEKAHTLCAVAQGALELYDGEIFRAVAARGLSDTFVARIRQGYRGAENPVTRPLLDGARFNHILDLAEIDHPISKAAASIGGLRTSLFVPLRRDGIVLGQIVSSRSEVRPFTDKQIALIENFAAQAVIAMENARLITELRQRTGDLQESLEYQTATSDVLKVISRSAFDLDTVLQTVVTTAVRLCRADSATIYRNMDDEYRWAAGHMLLPDYEQIERNVRIRPGTGTLVGRAASEGRTVQILDAWTDPLYEAKDDARVGGVHSMIGVPLLREGLPIGVIGLARRRIEAFSERAAQLVTTFADQAVIAIENARLFNELRARTAELGRSVEELKMLSDVGQAVSSTLDLRSVLSTILTASLGVTWANAGAVFRYSRAERAFRLVEAVGWDEALTRSVRDMSVAEADSAMGEAAARRMPVQLPDIARRPTPLRDITVAAGYHSVLIVPLVGAERILGAIVLMRQETGEFPAETVRLMQTLASQSVLAIQNARMFREIADKSEQLALASQHKSQFLANMSHELRTPLNAILGYAELLVDGIYGALPDRPKGVLERVQNNGRHLLALINDVLDLAKIEAGQLTLTLEDYSLPEVIKSVVTAAEPLATSKGLKFTAAVQDGLPTGHGDARRLSQVLFNLVGNAIKFTDRGEVEIRAALEKGQFVLTVRDTGPGIAESDQDRIFGEFQQIDNSSTRQRGGTGLGLAISKRMVEMQGGTISVDSVLGHGSTFRVVLPVHVDEIMEEAA